MLARCDKSGLRSGGVACEMAPQNVALGQHLAERAIAFKPLHALSCILQTIQR
jgi:hypothetical protein